MNEYLLNLLDLIVLFFKPPRVLKLGKLKVFINCHLCERRNLQQISNLKAYNLTCVTLVHYWAPIVGF